MELHGHIRNSLTSLSPQEKQNVSYIARGLEYSFVGLTGYFAIAAAVTLVTSPIFGLLGACCYGALALITREFMVISQNTANLFDYNPFLPLDNFSEAFANFSAALSPEKFISLELKNTWILKPYFANHLVEFLKLDDSIFF